MRSGLESPIIHWAGFAVRIFYIYLRNLGIMAHHIQRAVAQQRLQRENISTRTQVGDGEGVAEFMRMGMSESCTLSQTPNEDAQAVTSERSGAGADEEGGFRVASILAGGQLTPDGFAGHLAKISNPALPTFRSATDSMPDVHLAGLQVHIFDGQRAKLGRAQPGIQQGQDHSLVTVGAGPAHDKRLPVVRLGFTRIDTGFDQLFKVFLGKRLNDGLRKFGWGDFFGGVGQLEFFAQPAVESSQSNVDIPQRFRRQGIFVPIPALWFVLSSHPGKIVGKIRRFDLGDVLIADVVHPLVQIVFIGVNRALA
jgi:hypothetical protein